MGKNNIIHEKTISFSIKLMHVCQTIVKEQKEFIITKQVIRSVTAIGGLVRESKYAESKPDFIHKLAIALKEAFETEYWILLMFEGQYLDKETYQLLTRMNKEIIRILIRIIKTSKENLQSKN